jgi:hypothetical protein
MKSQKKEKEAQHPSDMIGAKRDNEMVGSRETFTHIPQGRFQFKG